MSSKQFFITTPIYYVNDKPHIGHAYTTIASDVLARYHRLIGEEVFFLTGTDEHGSKVAKSAEKAGKTPQKFCDEISELFKKTFQNLELSYDYFIRTTDQRHVESVGKFMQKLWDNKDIYEGTYEGLYCTDCENFVKEKDLVEGKCPIHLKKPEKIIEKNYFFKLKKFLPQVKKLIESDEVKIRPIERKEETLSLIRQGLDDFSVSREKVKWGIPLSFDPSQACYVWIEALQNYISAIGYGDDKTNFEKWWNEEGPLHLMAKDILKFHAIYWPALLLAAGEKPPKGMFIHGFFSINGQKMSKTIGNVIDPNKMVKKFGPDATKYLLLSQFPFGLDGNIKESNFINQYNAELANGIGNLVSRTLTLLSLYNQNEVPETEEEISIEDPRTGNAWQISELLKISWKNYTKAMEELNFSAIISLINEKIIGVSNRLINDYKPWESWKENKTEWNKVMYCVAETIRQLAFMIRPLLPCTSDEIFKQLGIGEQSKILLSEQVTTWGGLKPGTKVKKGKALFPRIKK